MPLQGYGFAVVHLSIPSGTISVPIGQILFILGKND